MTGSRSAEAIWEPRVADYEDVVREAFAQQGAMRHIGASVERVEPGFVELMLPFREAITQQHGTVHGGVIGMLADTAAALAALSVADRVTVGLTVEYKLNLLAPAVGDVVIARGSLIRPGRPLSVAAADVYTVWEQRENLVATALGTFAAGRSRRPRADETG